jgi:hypothetical protein
MTANRYLIHRDSAGGPAAVVVGLADHRWIDDEENDVQRRNAQAPINAAVLVGIDMDAD